MQKQTFLLTLLLFGNLILYAQLTTEDYKVYSALIKTEILDTTKSVAILKTGIDSQQTSKSTSQKVKALVSNDLSSKYQVYTWTENSKNLRPSIIDSINAEYLVNFCESRSDKIIFEDDFNQTYETVILRNFPIQKKQ